jgi:hypothetical protein
MSLRERQIREVLDADYNISQQIKNRTRKNIQNDNTPLKRFRDTEIEVNTEQLVEGLNEVLNRKLSGLELMLNDPNIKSHQRADITNTGDVSQVWNQMVRYYQTPGISRTTQDMIKIKVQDLSQNIEAMVFGLNKLIQILSLGNQGSVVDVGKTLGVYLSIQQQLKSSEFRLINFGEVNTQIRDAISLLPEVAREQVSQAYQQANVDRNFSFPTGDFKERIRGIEDGLGVSLQDADRLKTFLPKDVQSRFSSTFGRLKDTARDVKDLDSQIEIIIKKGELLQNYIAEYESKEDRYLYQPQIAQVKGVLKDLENRLIVLQELKSDIQADFSYNEDFKHGYEYKNKIDNETKIQNEILSNQQVETEKQVEEQKDLFNMNPFLENKEQEEQEEKRKEQRKERKREQERNQPDEDIGDARNEQAVEDEKQEVADMEREARAIENFESKSRERDLSRPPPVNPQTISSSSSSFYNPPKTREELIRNYNSLTEEQKGIVNELNNQSAVNEMKLKSRTRLASSPGRLTDLSLSNFKEISNTLFDTKGGNKSKEKIIDGLQKNLIKLGFFSSSSASSSTGFGRFGGLGMKECHSDSDSDSDSDCECDSDCDCDCNCHHNGHIGYHSEHNDPYLQYKASKK